MLDELRKNAAGDKEYIVNELKKKIAELELKIEELLQKHAKETDQLIEQSKSQSQKYEQQIKDLQREHQTFIQNLKADHKQELDRLGMGADQRLELLRQEMTMDKNKAIEELNSKLQAEAKRVA